MTFSAYQFCWCVGQVTLLAMLAGAAIGIWLRRHPAASACVAAVATCLVLIVTLLAMTRLPWCAPWPLASGRASSAIMPTALSTVGPQSSASRATGASSMFDLAKATAWSLRSLQTAAPKGAARATIAAAAILIGIGLVRFLWAVNFTLRSTGKVNRWPTSELPAWPINSPRHSELPDDLNFARVRF
ncbi:MAG TPA: hypothetical protein VGM76_17315 [Lacipirellulaceae bacterium]